MNCDDLLECVGSSGVKCCTKGKAGDDYREVLRCSDSNFERQDVGVDDFGEECNNNCDGSVDGAGEMREEAWLFGR